MVSIAAGGTSAAFVPELAMVGTSLRDGGEELLASPHTLDDYGAKGVATGLPLLFPWANRLGGTSYPGPHGPVDLTRHADRLQFNGPLPIHGVLPNLLPFRVTAREQHAVEAEFDAASSPPVLEVFPFPHRLTVRAEVAAGVLTVTTTLAATGDVPVPVSFGYHPYFRLPGSERDTWKLGLSARRHQMLDDRLLPTGATEPADISGLPLAGTSFDDGYTDLGPAPELAVWDGRRRLAVRLEHGYPYAQVYAPAGRQLIALEPMTAPADALRSGAGLRHAEPGAEVRARFSIVVAATDH